MPIPKRRWKPKLQEFYNCPDRFVRWLETQWRIKFKKVRRDINIQGSPERTLARFVIEDKQGRLFLLEKFAKHKYLLRSRVAAAVDHLHGRGLSQAGACQKSVCGEFLPFFEDACFQLSRFYFSSGIKRPGYLNCRETGRSFADFLIRLSDAAKGIETVISPAPFSIKAYIYDLFAGMRIHDPEIYDAFAPVLAFLETKFMDIHDAFQTGFCHGDLHPLNVIWDHHRIKVVIDWEFAGFKPDIYDAANIVGCAGIEDPDGLGRPMVMSFLSVLRDSGMFSDTGWWFFPEYVIALRFAWLSEWLRKKDQQMLEMEAAYLTLLVKNVDVLRKGWGIA